VARLAAGHRGVDTILKDLGVDDLTIQEILRQGDVNVTRRSYIKRLDKSFGNAMDQFEVEFGRSSGD
jgi:hypothetical protein